MGVGEIERFRERGFVVLRGAIDPDPIAHEVDRTLVDALDSDDDIPSVGCVAYLDPVSAADGALRVVPGSHLDREMPIPGFDARGGGDNGEAVETIPGDVIVFHERLIHGSRGGGQRRQWRVDFVIDPRDVGEEASVRAWFDQSVPDEQHNPGYDASRYPSYGAFWRARDRPWTNRLRELGAYQRSAGTPDAPSSLRGRVENE